VLAGFGAARVGAEPVDEQYVLMTSGSRLTDADVDAVESAGMEVRSRIDEVGVVVANGTRSQADATGFDYAPDIEYRAEVPNYETLEAKAEAETECFDHRRTAEELAELKWDTDSQNVREAHEVTKGDGVRVGVIDSGVDHRHPDLDHAVNEELSQAVSGRDRCAAPGPWSGGHGTHVAGIIAASDDNGGVVGVAPDCEIVDLRYGPAKPKYADVCEDGSEFTPGDLEFTVPRGVQFGVLLQAIVRGVNVDCDVLNMSLSIGHRRERSENGRFYGQAWARTTAYANRNGTLIVSSAGNADVDLQHDKGTFSLLTEAPNVMSVAATGPLGYMWGPEGYQKPPWTPSKYSNDGVNVIDVGAAGGNFPFDDDISGYGDDPWHRDLVLSTVPLYKTEGIEDNCDPFYPVVVGPDEAPYRWLAGTSMSSPQVAGVAALVKSVDPDAPPKKVRAIINSTAHDVGETFHLGAGYIDAAAAVEKARK
jgi:subtilisin family serine protease